jgi:hypothetical protein
VTRRRPAAGSLRWTAGGPTGHETARLRALVQVAMDRVRGVGGPARAVESLWAEEGTGT